VPVCSAWPRAVPASALQEQQMTVPDLPADGLKARPGTPGHQFDSDLHQRGPQGPGSMKAV